MLSDPLRDKISQMDAKAREYWERRYQAIETARAAVDMCKATGEDPTRYEERLRELENAPPLFPVPKN